MGTLASLGASEALRKQVERTKQQTMQAQQAMAPPPLPPAMQQLGPPPEGFSMRQPSPTPSMGGMTELAPPPDLTVPSRSSFGVEAPPELLPTYHEGLGYIGPPISVPQEPASIDSWAPAWTHRMGGPVGGMIAGGMIGNLPGAMIGGLVGGLSGETGAQAVEQSTPLPGTEPISPRLGLNEMEGFQLRRPSPVPAPPGINQAEGYQREGYNLPEIGVGGAFGGLMPLIPAVPKSLGTIGKLGYLGGTGATEAGAYEAFMQAAKGEELDPGNIAIAGGLGGAIPAGGYGAFKGIQRALRGGGRATPLPEYKPGGNVRHRLKYFGEPTQKARSGSMDFGERFSGKQVPFRFDLGPGSNISEKTKRALRSLHKHPEFGKIDDDVLENMLDAYDYDINSMVRGGVDRAYDVADAGSAAAAFDLDVPSPGSKGEGFDIPPPPPVPGKKLPPRAGTVRGPKRGPKKKGLRVIERGKIVGTLDVEDADGNPVGMVRNFPPGGQGLLNEARRTFPEGIPEGATAQNIRKVYYDYDQPDMAEDLILENMTRHPDRLYFTPLADMETKSAMESLAKQGKIDLRRSKLDPDAVIAKMTPSGMKGRASATPSMEEKVLRAGAMPDWAKDVKPIRRRGKRGGMISLGEGQADLPEKFRAKPKVEASIKDYVKLEGEWEHARSGAPASERMSKSLEKQLMAKEAKAAGEQGEIPYSEKVAAGLEGQEPVADRWLNRQATKIGLQFGLDEKAKDALFAKMMTHRRKGEWKEIGYELDLDEASVRKVLDPDYASSGAAAREAPKPKPVEQRVQQAMPKAKPKPKQPVEQRLISQGIGEDITSALEGDLREMYRDADKMYPDSPETASALRQGLNEELRGMGAKPEPAPKPPIEQRLAKVSLGKGKGVVGEPAAAAQAAARERTGPPKPLGDVLRESIAEEQAKLAAKAEASKKAAEEARVSRSVGAAQQADIRAGRRKKAAGMKVSSPPPAVKPKSKPAPRPQATSLPPKPGAVAYTPKPKKAPPAAAQPPQTKPAKAKPKTGMQAGKTTKSKVLVKLATPVRATGQRGAPPPPPGSATPVQQAPATPAGPPALPPLPPTTGLSPAKPRRVPVKPLEPKPAPPTKMDVEKTNFYRWKNYLANITPITRDKKLDLLQRKFADMVAEAHRLQELWANKAAATADSAFRAISQRTVKGAFSRRSREAGKGLAELREYYPMAGSTAKAGDAIPYSNKFVEIVEGKAVPRTSFAREMADLYQELVIARPGRIISDMENRGKPVFQHGKGGPKPFKPSTNNEVWIRQHTRAFDAAMKADPNGPLAQEFYQATASVNPGMGWQEVKDVFKEIREADIKGAFEIQRKIKNYPAAFSSPSQGGKLIKVLETKPHGDRGTIMSNVRDWSSRLATIEAGGQRFDKDQRARIKANTGIDAPESQWERVLEKIQTKGGTHKEAMQAYQAIARRPGDESIGDVSSWIDKPTVTAETSRMILDTANEMKASRSALYNFFQFFNYTPRKAGWWNALRGFAETLVRSGLSLGQQRKMVQELAELGVLSDRYTDWDWPTTMDAPSLIRALNNAKSGVARNVLLQRWSGKLAEITTATAAKYKYKQIIAAAKKRGDLTPLQLYNLKRIDIPKSQINRMRNGMESMDDMAHFMRRIIDEAQFSTQEGPMSGFYANSTKSPIIKRLFPFYNFAINQTHQLGEFANQIYDAGRIAKRGSKKDAAKIFGAAIGGIASALGGHTIAGEMNIMIRKWLDGKDYQGGDEGIERLQADLMNSGFMGMFQSMWEAPERMAWKGIGAVSAPAGTLQEMAQGAPIERMIPILKSFIRREPVQKSRQRRARTGGGRARRATRAQTASSP